MRAIPQVVEGYLVAQLHVGDVLQTLQFTQPMKSSF